MYELMDFQQLCMEVLPSCIWSVVLAVPKSSFIDKYFQISSVENE